ncbi:elongation factor P--(R)-beta-lysine ligase [Psychromonas sp. Urea-02u-13]|uniref:elongation factor P--(R)-beta-lysine ligase n=1 Tax=Psychromonas sp. Urea-02u-13 TaxID=2058326 RepID=UPI000C33AE25|nr:elongation factor P--(R)-beta-lysine ligase [Psychromonas sp. Urea-02u-13]PKG40808.1 elongation factor P lysine(34) lysyltransferase [Psychromonas sp. Urea-02u-13]
MNWLPNADLSLLKKRAVIIQTIRSFFIERELLEVETPSLSQAGVTDQHLFCFKTHFIGPEISDVKPDVLGVPLYLQTSPEFHMKRLLSAGSGSIFQISKAFRNEESGRYHNPEFTLLEWYQVGFDHFQLMDEMEELLRLVLNCGQAKRLTYQQAFMLVLNVDPLSASLEVLKTAGSHLNLGDVLDNEADYDTVLQLLFCVAIEPVIANDSPCFVYDFPASQAALARISPVDQRVAERFEVYYKGIELANGFHELSDSEEQLSRFKKDNRLRKENGLLEMPIDTRFVESLKILPDCAGVALGIDRLIMLATEQDHIDNVVSFTIKGA